MKYAVKPLSLENQSVTNTPLAQYPVTTLEVEDTTQPGDLDTGWLLLDYTEYQQLVQNTRSAYQAWIEDLETHYVQGGEWVVDRAIAAQFDGVKVRFQTTDEFMPGTLTFHWNGTPCTQGYGLIEHGRSEFEIEPDAYGNPKPPRSVHNSWAEYQKALPIFPSTSSL